MDLYIITRKCGVIMLKNPTCTTTTDAFMRYVLTDMCCLSASSTAVTSLEMTLNSAHQVTERLLIGNISCINMVTYPKVIPSFVVWKVQDNYPAPEITLGI